MSTDKRNNIPLVVLLGPTASGKSSHAIELAREFGGEIVSADSRQVYKQLDIGSGKVTPEEQAMVQHHLLDVAEPGTRFTVADFKQLADAALADIWKRGKLPFLVGGSSLYLDVVIENYQIPSCDQDENYRLQLERRALDDLVAELNVVDPVVYETIDKKNRRRVSRALEVFHLTGIPLSEQKRKGDNVYASLLLGVAVSREELYDKIDRRVDERIAHGMLQEVEGLLAQGVSQDWLKNLGLEYRILTEFLCDSDRSDIELQKHLQKLKFAIHDFARRQIIWYRRNTSIVWCSTYEEMRSSIRSFLAQF